MHLLHWLQELGQVACRAGTPLALPEAMEDLPGLRIGQCLALREQQVQRDAALQVSVPLCGCICGQGHHPQLPVLHQPATLSILCQAAQYGLAACTACNGCTASECIPHASGRGSNHQAAREQMRTPALPQLYCSGKVDKHAACQPEPLWCMGLLLEGVTGQPGKLKDDAAHADDPLLLPPLTAPPARKGLSPKMIFKCSRMHCISAQTLTCFHQPALLQAAMRWQQDH